MPLTPTKKEGLKVLGWRFVWVMKLNSKWNQFTPTKKMVVSANLKKNGAWMKSWETFSHDHSNFF